MLNLSFSKSLLAVAPVLCSSKCPVNDPNGSTVQRQRRELRLLMAELKDREKELNTMSASQHKQLLAWEQDRQRMLALEQRCARFNGEIPVMYSIIVVCWLVLFEGETLTAHLLLFSCRGAAEAQRGDQSLNAARAGGRNQGGGGEGGTRRSPTAALRAGAQAAVHQPKMWRIWGSHVEVLQMFMHVVHFVTVKADNKNIMLCQLC